MTVPAAKTAKKPVAAKSATKKAVAAKSATKKAVAAKSTTKKPVAKKPRAKKAAAANANSEDNVRRYTVVCAKCNDVSFDEKVFSTRSAVFKGKYPSIAAKKAIGGLRTKFGIDEDTCDIWLAVREQTQGSDKKISFYVGRVAPRDVPIVIKKSIKTVVDGVETFEEREVVYRMETKSTHVNKKSDMYPQLLDMLKSLAPTVYDTYMANKPRRASVSPAAESSGTTAAPAVEAVSEPSAKKTPASKKPRTKTPSSVAKKSPRTSKNAAVAVN